MLKSLLDRIRSRINSVPRARPAGHDPSDALAVRATELLQQDLQASDPALLDEGIELLKRAVSASTADHPFYAERLNNLGTALLRRSLYSDSPDDIRGAINACSQAVSAAAADDPERAMYLGNLGNALITQFAHTGGVADLDRAVEASEQASAAMPADFPDPGFFLSNLGNALLVRFQQNGSAQDLDRAVELDEKSLALAPDGHPARTIRLSNLMRALGIRFRFTGSLEDIDRSIKLGGQAAAAMPTGDPNRALVLMNLSVMLESRFERTGAPADLDRAVEVGEQAVTAAAGNLSYETTTLGVLGTALRTRFEVNGSTSDLNRAVEVGDRAVAASPRDLPDYPALLSLLGVSLTRRARRTGSMADLDRAVDVSEQAVAAAGPGHPRQTMARLNLVLTLGERFERTGAVADLNRSIEVGEQTLNLKDTEIGDRAKALSALSVSMISRFGQTGASEDQDRAIDLGEQAVAATPADHPDRAAYLLLLNDALRTRARGTGPDEDTGQLTPALQQRANRAMAACQEAAAVATAPPWMRASAAAQWGHWAIGAEDWLLAVDGFALAVGLLGVVVPRALERRDQEHELASLVGVGSLAAACCLQAGNPQRAVELWEHGRGVLLNQTLDTRTDLTELAEQQPGLAGRFVRLRDLMDKPLPPPGADVDPEGAPSSPQSALDRRRQVAADFDAVLEEIRSQPGFGTFLRPPSFGDLAAVSDRGPVVLINVTDVRSDALILQRGEVMTIRLSGLSPAAVRKRTDDFRIALDAAAAADPETRVNAETALSGQLEWLWDVITGPILDRLGITAAGKSLPAWPRLWWCPSGLLAFLPLHAAGYQETRFDSVPKTVMDRVVSSYIPTVRSLSYARRPAAQASPGHGRAVVVAMPHTPHAADLPAATEEASFLSQALGDQALVLTGPQATHDRVTAAMTGYPWAHFACHGDSVLADPSASQLLLQDHLSRPLTVLDVMGLRLDNAQFAYLSACSTARSGSQLPDEAIHLAAAFHLAGDRHVIATLWPAGDRAALALATGTYPALLAAGSADCATDTLHDAALALRLVHSRQPSVWAAHMHTGA